MAGTIVKSKTALSKALLLAAGIVGAGVVLAISLGLTSSGQWVKADNGLWVKQGEPKDAPAVVVQQQILLIAAQALYQEANSANKNLAYGPCLGLIGEDWVVDIAHDPRLEIDNDSANQCPEFFNGTATHFIELDPDGNLIRIQ